MGMVVAAQHLQLGQLVALKFLLPQAMQSEETTERFLREARATVRLKSEHVGRVIDVGTLDTGAPYIVMEYLDGQDLDGFRRVHTRLPVMQAVDFVLQASEAVAEAHSIGIIHRDLKPANLFLSVRADGTPIVKVLDFGISKATQDQQDFSLTRTATVMGSPGYMSPEQLRSARDVDARTDVWALGVILYELVSGNAPFAAEAITELTLKVAMDPTPPLGVPAPAGFEDVIRKCLEKDPANRYGSIAELAAALVPFGPPNASEMAKRIARVQAGLSTNTRQKSAVAVALAPTTLSGSTGYALTASGAEPPKSRRGLYIGIGAAVFAAIVAVAFIIAGGGGGKTAAAGGTTGSQPATGAASASGSAAATGAASASASGSDTGSATASGTGSASGSDSGSATASGSDSGSATASGSGSGSATGSDSGSSMASGADSGSGKGSSRGGRGGKGGKGGKGSGSASGSASTGSGSGSDFGNSRF
jgi:serine/threonine-protein kinase